MAETDSCRSSSTESSDEDTYDTLMAKALWVDEETLKTLEEADISVPTSAEEYLALVRRERRSLPNVVSVKKLTPELDEKKEDWQQTTFDFPFVKLLPAPEGFDVSPVWEKARITQFSNLREAMEDWRTHYSSADHRESVEELKKLTSDDWLSRTFPESKKDLKPEHYEDESVDSKQAVERQAINSMQLTPMCTVFWPTFDKTCGGKGLTHLDKGPLLGERKLEEVDDPSACGVLPLVSNLVSMPQIRIRELLEAHVEYMRRVGFSQFQGRWLFGLLVALKKPLLAETASTLRDMAKICSIYRSRLPNKDHSLLPGLNLLITLVAGYFDQTDLRAQ